MWRWLKIWWYSLTRPDEITTIRAILLKSAWTTHIFDHLDVVDQYGLLVDWQNVGVDVLKNSADATHCRIRVNDGLRHVRVYNYQGKRYAFVFAHPEDPGAIEPGQWHGAGFIELI